MKRQSSKIALIVVVFLGIPSLLQAMGSSEFNDRRPFDLEELRPLGKTRAEIVNAFSGLPLRANGNLLSIHISDSTTNYTEQFKIGSSGVVEEIHFLFPNRGNNIVDVAEKINNTVVGRMVPQYINGGLIIVFDFSDSNIPAKLVLLQQIENNLWIEIHSKLPG